MLRCPHLGLVLLLTISTISQRVIGAEVAPAPDPAVPLHQVQIRATPVVTSRSFSKGFAPNPRGGWNWIGQFMNYKATGDKVKVTVPLPTGQHYLAYQDTNIRPEAEWVIIDLQTGQSKIVDLPGFHSSVPPVLAGNGRLFFSVDYGHIYYYDPVDETVKILGRTHDSLDVLRGYYKFLLGPDGMIYGSAQTTCGTTTVIRINPDTLDYKVITDVGVKGRRELTYGYYLGIQPPWIYVAVGQGVWELWAVNMDTGAKQMLAERLNEQNARVTVEHNAQGNCTAQLHGDPERESVLLNDGQIVARAKVGEKLPSLPAGSWPELTFAHSKVVTASTAMPQLIEKDPVSIEADGTGLLHWRPAGDAAAVQTSTFKINRAEPQGIEALTALPDGSILGSTRSYSGWFRYHPAADKLDFFGKGGPSRARTTILDGKVYFAGYPNTTLYVYDPTLPWRDALTKDANANPRQIGSQGQGRSEAHYAVSMASMPGRVYTLGRRERWSTGTGLCCYFPEKDSFIYLGQENKDLEPVDFALLPQAGKLVVSGARKDAQLLVYDLDFKELTRITLQPGLENTGDLLTVGDATFIGWYHDPTNANTVLYLYDLAAGKLVKSIQLPAESGPVFARAQDHTYWLFANQALYRLDPTTLQMQAVARLERMLGAPFWIGKELYGRIGGQVVKVDGTLP